MLKIFKKRCKHEWVVNRWHYLHEPYSKVPKQIEIELKCTICGKLDYRHIFKAKEQEAFAKEYADKKW